MKQQIEELKQRIALNNETIISCTISVTSIHKSLQTLKRIYASFDADEALTLEDVKTDIYTLQDKYTTDIASFLDNIKAKQEINKKIEKALKTLEELDII